MPWPHSHHYRIDTTKTPDVDLASESDLDDFDVAAQMDFEPGSEADRQSLWRASWKAGRDDAFRVVTDPKMPWFLRCGRFAGHAARFSVRHGGYAGDFDKRPNENGILTSRSELRENFAAEMDQTYWYAFRTLIPEDFPEETNRCVIAQWHASDTDGESTSPPLSLRYEDGVLKIVAIHSEADPVTAESQVRERLYNLPDFPKNQWHDFVFQTRWANDGTGLVRVWLNGDLVVDYHGPVGYHDADGPYFKFGVYRDEEFFKNGNEDSGEKIPATDPYVIYHDDYRRGRFAKDVL